MLNLSVVIPLYNKAPYIERAIRSVLAQTFQDFEIIVVDDGSTDNSPEIVKSISDSRIRLIQQENAGVSAARNKGIWEAKTDLIAFLDADDAWKPKFLETILRLRKKFPEAGAYATAYEIHEHNGKIVRPKYKAIPPPPWEGLIPNYFRSTLGQPPVSSSSVAIPKYVFEDVGGFPVGETLGEDLDMWGRIALKYSIVFSSNFMSAYLRDDENRACKRFHIERELAFVKTANLLIQEGRVPPHLLVDLKEYVAKLQIGTASHYIRFLQNPTAARKLLMTCRSTKKFKAKWIWCYLRSLFPMLITLKKSLF